MLIRIFLDTHTHTLCIFGISYNYFYQISTNKKTKSLFIYFQSFVEERMQSKQLYISTYSPFSSLLSQSLFLIFFSSIFVECSSHVISRLMKLRATESNRKDEERRTEFDHCENTMSIYASTVPPARSAAKRARASRLNQIASKT